MYNNPGFGGKADNVPGHNVGMANSYALTTVVAHEIGHTLNLWHTFHGQEDDGCPEDANGANCTSCGDYVCDTPADPYNGGSYFSDANCNYIGQPGYNPDVTNYMSYSSPACLNHFTTGQSNRINNALLNAAVLQPVILNITGNSAFCSSSTFILNNVVPGETIVWTASPIGVISLAAVGNQVTVTKVSGGYVTLTATVNDISVITSFTTIAQITNISYNMTGPCQNGYQNWYLSATANMPATNWLWTPSSPNSGTYVIQSPNSSSTNIQVSGGGGINVTFKDPCGATSALNGVTIWSPCGRAMAITYYPNPATNQLIVENKPIPVSDQASAEDVTIIETLNNFSVELFNEKGKTLRSGNSTKYNQIVVLNTTEIPSGKYYLHIKQGTDMVRK